MKQNFSPLSKSKGNWLLSTENQDRLVEKLGIDSESFARSTFTAWDTDEDGLLTKKDLGNGLFLWKRHRNPAINVSQADHILCGTSNLEISHNSLLTAPSRLIYVPEGVGRETPGGGTAVECFGINFLTTF